MIRINCTHCKAQLSIDEAFAGGVCRCQFCGTIQTVPKHLKGAEDMQAASMGGTPKSLYQTRAKSSDPGMSSGLDAIADIVAGSGLSGSGLSSGNLRRAGRPAGAATSSPATAAPAKNKLIPVIVGGGIVIIMLLGVVIGMLMKGGGSGGAGSSAENPTPQQAVRPVEPAKTPAPAVTAVVPRPQPVEPPPPDIPVPDLKSSGPAYFGMKLTDPSVVFVIDRGSATHDSFEYMKMACLNALDSFQPDQKYQIVFWKLDKDKDPVVIPKALTPVSNKSELSKAAKALDDVTSFGQSDLKPALDKAFAAKPAAIVIATGKPLDDTFVKTVMDARKGAAVKVHCLSMVERTAVKPMQDVAKKTGGTFKFVSLSELRSVER